MGELRRKTTAKEIEIMKNAITGIVFGLLLAVSMAALAVNYSRDIEPLNKAVSALQDRVKSLEDKTRKL